MKLAVISDLHLGAGDRADHFDHEDEGFLRFLDVLEADFERIVLLGDVYETLSGRLPGSPARQLERARAAHPRLAERFERPRYTWVHGNHDLVAARVAGAPEQEIVEADGLRILFTHGHHHDRLIRHARALSETGVWLGGWITRAGLGRVRRALSELEDRMRVSERPEACSFQRWATARARAHQADIVVTGHTHTLAHHDHGDVVFMNSGACCDGQFNFVSIDTKRVALEVHPGW